MIITRNLSKHLVFEGDTIVVALRKISDNKSGIVFCVESNGTLIGALTDGDFRRFVTSGEQFDPDAPVGDIVNREVIDLPVSSSADVVSRALTQRISHIPLLDPLGRVVAIASLGTATLAFGERVIDETAPALCIAEIGINHNGDKKRAFDLVDAAADAGADCAKFQMRDLDSLYRGGRSVTADEDLGVQYTVSLLERFSLTVDDMFDVLDHCVTRGLIPLCTPWDLATVEHLEFWGVPGYKIASADLTNHELVERVAGAGKPVLLSTGMSTELEIVEVLRVLRRSGAAFALLHCNSAYPAPFKDLNLSYMKRLREIGECLVGYSGHERGYVVAVSAVALGAKIVEKHFTLDRSLEGNDHKVSLLPAEFEAMVAGIRQVEESLGTDDERTMTQGELMNRASLSKSLIAARDLNLGEVVARSDVRIQSPGQGLQPNRIDELVGRQVERPIEEGDYFTAADVGDTASVPRDYGFRRPWGIPVRFHDASAFRATCAPDLWEFHHSYRDLDLRPEDFLSSKYANELLVVHSPELFSHDLTLDLSSRDGDTRDRSITELRRVVRAAVDLLEWFPSTPRVPIVINCSDADGALAGKSPTLRWQGYERIAESLDGLEDSRIEFIPQTMPPFPWYFGGQQVNTMFVDPEEIARFCEEFGSRICFDLSHSKLAANHLGLAFSDFVGLVAPHAAHLHVVDASGVDGEGVQVGSGEIDFAAVGRQLDDLAPGVGFIPEIWQGHADGGHGFWEALDLLEGWL